MLETVEFIKEDIWRCWGRQLAILRKGGKYLEGIRRYLGGSLKVMKVTLENLQTSDMLF